MSIFSISAFSQNLPNTLPDTGYVGVGTSTPTCNFQVVGTSQISGSLTVDSSITIADSANINNNLRVNGNLFVAKNAYISDTTFSNALRVNRITPGAGDSIIYFGDSSLVVNTISHLIYPEADFDIPNPIIKGTGIGSPNITPKGDYSVAMGHRINIDAVAKNSVAIGTGVLPNGPYLQQYIPNSIMLGTNSNLPTLFISPANGINTTGRVGIGTTNPSTTLDINTIGNIAPSIKLNNNLGLHADLMYYQNNILTSLIRMGKDANGTTWSFEDRTKQGTDIHRMYIAGNGIVYIREVEVNVPAFPDYVFSDGYKLIGIKELEKFIAVYKHLPNIPSAKEVEENGSVAVGKLMVKQLEKIEELTLYIIQLEKRISELENK